MGNHSFFSGILDIRSSLLGVGLVCSVTSEGIESFIAQVGGGVVLSIGCGTLDARFCLFRTGQNIAVAIFNFLQNLLHVLGDVRIVAIFSILAGNYRAGFAGGLGGYIVISIFIDNAVSNFILAIRILGQYTGRFIFRVVACIGQGLADFICRHAALADRIIIFRPCIAAVFIEGRCTGFGFPRHRIHLPIHGLRLAAGNGGVVNIWNHRAGKSLGIKGSVDGQVRHTGDCACGSDFHRADFAGCCCDFAICLHGELATSPFDFPFSRIQGSFCITIVIIASGVETLFIHGSTVLAHFDALIVHGDRIISIYVQHQLIHSRGCGAVVSGDFGNHAVVAHFEVILVGLFASSFFSCHCIGIGLDLRIQVSKIFVYFFAYL